MKQIQQVNIWQGGASKAGTVLNSYVISDNLLDSATFYYSILTQTLEPITQGNLTMVGESYDLYSTNEDAWDWVSTQLNVTITGDYIPVEPDPIIPE